ncbi:hypothetical protein AB1Y20_021433 [Prymnesium parvum]|uniref:Peptidase A1 domain-containing protein n=1 Tax=Prymnesium parvum TaxID=97485 RepID=A0AB34JJM5_PRYPA
MLLSLLLSPAAPATPQRPHAVHLGRYTTNAAPTSRVHALLANGSSIPAGGAVWPTAIYWARVEVGTPPISFPVAIDSGSGDLDIAGNGCSGCVTKPPNRAYDPASSSTSSAAFPYFFSNTYETCDLKQPTAPCTISGRLHKDQVSLAGLGPVEVTFGSILRQTSNFDQFKEIDGVMGFTMGGKQNVFAQLVASGKAKNVWAICMQAGSKSNGTLTIGGVDERLSDGPIEYVPDAGQGFHSVSVSSLVLGDHSPIAVGQPAILDTGTNVLLLPSKLMAQLKAQMCADTALAHCNELWGNQCVSLSKQEVAAYPPLALQLNSQTKLEMTASDYLLLGSPLATSSNQYCLGIRDGGSAGGNGFIIGDTTMRHYYLVFDLERKRIGWGKVRQCGSVDEGEVVFELHSNNVSSAASRCPHGEPANCAKIDFCTDCGNCPTAPCYCAECAAGYVKRSSGCGSIADMCVAASKPIKSTARSTTG